jgi:hypothetical protein
MIQIRDLLKCAICHEIYTGTPIILPCCHKTICEHHTKKPKHKYACDLCEAPHNMNKRKKFATNETIVKLLNIEINDKFANLGDIYVRATKQISSLEDKFCKVKDLIKNPKNFITKTIRDHKQQVDLRKEKLKTEIDVICAEIIQNLDKYQQQCYDNIQSLKLEENTSDTFLEIQEYIDEWTKDDKKLLMVSNDLKRREIEAKAKELDINLFVRHEILTEKIMMKQVCFCRISASFVNDFKNELKQFEK